MFGSFLILWSSPLHPSFCFWPCILLLALHSASGLALLSRAVVHTWRPFSRLDCICFIYIFLYLGLLCGIYDLFLELFYVLCPALSLGYSSFPLWMLFIFHIHPVISWPLWSIHLILHSWWSFLLASELKNSTTVIQPSGIGQDAPVLKPGIYPSDIHSLSMHGPGSVE